ncbi:hypothetical protein K2173_016144 [Erythroxylum novogranatense]|uniref:E3 ubiquitin ligase n=1 Tax=Erythroxylum novogranatense TaxID=1862640 RepID=A0AAV8SG38_9ROSI|nr:hypothetical protein K2173_016144 [Erythroxylum novogranatense]
MSVCATEMKTVAIAVKGRAGVGGRGSRRAVRWAVQHLFPVADRFIFVHVMPIITYLPTPSGHRIPVEEVDENVVAMYVKEARVKKEAEIFTPFMNLCKFHKVETLLLEDGDPAVGLLKYAAESGIDCLVLGSCSRNWLMRKLRGPGIPRTLLNFSPQMCDFHVIYKYKVVKKLANSLDTDETIAQVTGSPVESNAQKVIGIPSLLDFSYPDAEVFKQKSSSLNGSIDVEGAGRNSVDNLLSISSRARSCGFTSSVEMDKSYEQAEIEQLRLELQSTITMYKRACEELVHTQNKVQSISSECLEEAGRVHAALEREETLRKIAAEEKARYMQALKEIEEAKELLAKETYGREVAEQNAFKESSEKQKLVSALLSSDKRYRRYSKEEMEVATNFFCEARVIGEGGFGKVYKCNLDHTPAAVKVLWSEAANKKDEFLKEVEVLSQLHHPHLVLLLGACPESGCLVYEYLENGSLEECIFQHNGKKTLPWFVRFRIIFEVACGLSFLHNSKPDPIVHRDLKPGNILIGKNYVAKIGDVGLAKLISDVVPDNITEYRDSILAGTIYYMDPEYQRTGTIRPKSDLYAFGIIVLQILTGRRPNGIVHTVQTAITNASFANVLDSSIKDWPLAESQELAQIALKCSKLRCRDRPDLDTEVLPSLRRLMDIAADSMKVELNDVYAPSHYFCPILQQIMDDPYIAADGFTYEHRAIKLWLEKHNISPVTKLRLQHSIVIPNHTLRSAIHEWSSRVNS